MDYLTKSASREDMRGLSKLFRHIFEVKDGEKFPVLQALERTPDVFKGTSWQVIEDYKLPQNILACCSPDANGNFTIKIKDSVYSGAVKGIGAYRGFICHEICHVFLYKIGYTPIFNMEFENNKIPPYCSVEWQTKALCGEVMMPFESTKNLSKEEIIEIYGVSKGFAEKRKKY